MQSCAARPYPWGPAWCRSGSQGCGGRCRSGLSLTCRCPPGTSWPCCWSGRVGTRAQRIVIRFFTEVLANESCFTEELQLSLPPACVSALLPLLGPVLTGVMQLGCSLLSLAETGLAGDGRTAERGGWRAQSCSRQSAERPSSGESPLTRILLQGGKAAGAGRPAVQGIPAVESEAGRSSQH